VRGRNELAKKQRTQGDREAADGVRVLKKPSRVAWLLNQFSARGAKLRDELLDAGEALREAQERLVAGEGESADLREASSREREAVSAALAAVEALAGDAGARLSPAAIERARQTLHAVALDEGVRQAFERHRLITEHDAPGLGGLSPGAAPTSRGGAKTTRSQDAEREEEKRRRGALKAAEAEARKLAAREEKAEREVEAARQAAQQAQQDLERLTNELNKAAGEAAAASERVDNLRG
jgi:chromosome segregation ATPase